jgi:hypothetical protein
MRGQPVGKAPLLIIALPGCGSNPPPRLLAVIGLGVEAVDGTTDTAEGEDDLEAS